MRLTDFLEDAGKIVAFYPGLKRVTGSVTASLLLSQLFYWCDKTKDKDGWIYKTNYDLEEETSLSVYEQQTARKVLIELGILEEEFKRLDHTMRFRLNLDRLNDLWEKSSGKNERAAIVGQQPMSLKDFQNPELHKNDPVLPPLPPPANVINVKKGDMMDGIVNYALSKAAKKEAIKTDIRNQIENLLHINTGNNSEWDGFIDYAYIRQENFNEPINKWILWAIKNNFNPMFWTPKKCRTMYPQAFVEDTVNKPREDFVEKQPEQKEEHYDPMPEKAKPKRRLY
jgi:hypothetical protein